MLQRACDTIRDSVLFAHGNFALNRVSWLGLAVRNEKVFCGFARKTNLVHRICV